MPAAVLVVACEASFASTVVIVSVTVDVTVVVRRGALVVVTVLETGAAVSTSTVGNRMTPELSIVCAASGVTDARPAAVISAKCGRVENGAFARRNEAGVLVEVIECVIPDIRWATNITFLFDDFGWGLPGF